jgi:hypothetical protein
MFCHQEKARDGATRGHLVQMILATNNKPQYRDDFKFIINKSLVLHLVAYFEILLQVLLCFLRFEKAKGEDF